jgi:4-hydroxybenzoate polyprenyltransferase
MNYWLKIICLKLESLYWMTRPSSRTSIVLPLMGYLSVDPYPSLINLIGILLFISFAKSAYVLLNDLLDADKDIITAPHLPIPSRLFSKSEVAAWIIFFSMSTVFIIFLIVHSIYDFLVCLLLLIIGFLVGYLYSKFKHLGAIANILAAIPFCLTVIIGWVVAGHSNLYVIPIVLYSFVIGISNNIVSTLFDMDKDLLVGNKTISISLGPKRTVAIIMSLNLLNAVIIVFASLQSKNIYFPVAIEVSSIFTMLASLGKVVNNLIEEDRGRIQRVDDMKIWGIGTYLSTLALLCSFSINIGLVVGIIVWILSEISLKGYKERLTSGKLASYLLEVKSS